MEHSHIETDEQMANRLQIQYAVPITSDDDNFKKEQTGETWSVVPNEGTTYSFPQQAYYTTQGANLDPEEGFPGVHAIPVQVRRRGCRLSYTFLARNTERTA